MKRRANCFLNVYKVTYFVGKKQLVNEHLKTIQGVFQVKIYTKLKPIECRITYLLYIFYNVIVL